MIIIGKPYVYEDAVFTYLKCKIKDELNPVKKEYTIWYQVDKEYGKYLTEDVADAFLLVMSSIGIFSHQDIEVHAAVSEKFLFNLKNSVMPMLCEIITGGRIIKIEADEMSHKSFSSEGIGTGCSLGVDSFTSICKHYFEENIYKISHLAIFNSGQLGDVNLKNAEIDFFNTKKKLELFSKEIGLPLVAVNTNLNEVFLEYKVPFLQRYVQTTISCVLALQKLFKVYFIANSFPVNKLTFSSKGTALAEGIIDPLLSTDNTQIILSTPMMNRVDKTILINKFPIVRKYLDVCWANQISNQNNNSTLRYNKTKLNCGKCGKCLRTLFTLYVLGEIENYRDIFDLDEFEKYRKKYIIKILSYRKKDVYLEEIYQLMKDKNFKIPFNLRLCSFGVRLGIYKLLNKYVGYTTMAK